MSNSPAQSEPLAAPAQNQASGRKRTRTSVKEQAARRYGTQYHTSDGVVETGLVDTAWTRLAMAGVMPLLLALTAVSPFWVTCLLVCGLAVCFAQGWPALIQAEHDNVTGIFLALFGIASAVTLTLTDEYGDATKLAGIGVLAVFALQMRSGAHEGLLEELFTAVSGVVVVVSGAAWCVFSSGLAASSVIVPTAVALLIGASLTVLEVPAWVLEMLTVIIPALTSCAVAVALALAGFFGPSHQAVDTALRSGAGCLVIGFVAGLLMAIANRVLWTHRWVPGGRAAITSAVLPVLAVGAPTYYIARVMAAFVAG